MVQSYKREYAKLKLVVYENAQYNSMNEMSVWLTKSISCLAVLAVSSDVNS
uniref:Uncharacterized protein n=1 Tax=Anguilla anguilla TaxID=7936 RepID=A0A0E9QRU7_ANGAN